MMLENRNVISEVWNDADIHNTFDFHPIKTLKMRLWHRGPSQIHKNVSYIVEQVRRICISWVKHGGQFHKVAS